MSKVMQCLDLEDLRALPRNLIDTFRPSNVLAKGYSCWDCKGDSSAFFALFFDNLATQLTLAGMAIGFGIPADFLYSHFMGGIGLSIFLGNLYYSLQASKVAMRTGNLETCAQPYGINTPGAIAKTFGVLMPAFFAAQASGLDQYAAAEKAWSIACAANFFGGIFEIIGTIAAPLITRNVPIGAILVPIGGVGITWLGFNPLLGMMNPHTTHNVIVGFIPMIIMWMSYYGRVTFGPFPPIGVAGLIGVILAWLVRLGDLETAGDLMAAAAQTAGAHGLKWSGCLNYLGEAARDYGSLVTGLACTNFIGTYACVLSAKKGGDVYSPAESMLVDGLGSVIGALFGSPYGTTVYIGHVSYKKMGAKRGYSTLNGVLYLFFGLFGVQGVLDAIVPHECVLGVIVLIGFSMATQVVESVDKRWYPCVLLGMLIAVSDYGVAGLQTPNKDITFLSNGYIWTSLLYTFALMMLTDRWFLAAAGVFAVMTLFSLVGLIHAAELNVQFDKHGTLLGEQNMAQAGESSGAPGWKFIVCYAVSSAICLICHLAQKKGCITPPEEEDFRQIQAADAAMMPEEKQPEVKDAGPANADA